MIRPIDAILVIAIAASAIWTFQIKHEAEIASAQVTELQKKIALEKERINLLRADWALLTQPQRLQKLVKQYASELNLQMLRPGQIIQLDELPDIVPLDDPIGVLAGKNGQLDGQSTGSVSRVGE